MQLLSLTAPLSPLSNLCLVSLWYNVLCTKLQKPNNTSIREKQNVMLRVVGFFSEAAKAQVDCEDLFRFVTWTEENMNLFIDVNHIASPVFYS